jgi:hypothetical protein
LTEGVIALVNGTIQGKGRIDWSANGKVTSEGDFSTASLDLAAAFGPVTGLSGNIHFDDLLNLTTPPGQTLAIKSANPGILAENGVLHYELLPNQLVRIERGEWPFMGGRLILHETVLNFGHPSAKRLTFEVVGLDAHTFVSSLGFKEIDATGMFDGVLPMIFDESGGGRSSAGGWMRKQEAGRSPITASSTRPIWHHGQYRLQRAPRPALSDDDHPLDGDLAGEFTTRLAIEGVGLGQTSTQKFIRSVLSRIPLKVNVTISGRSAR